MPLWLCTLVSLPSSLRAECPVTATGVCTPGIEETIVITETESIEYEADGHTVTTTTTTDTTTVTVTNEDSGDVLDGDNGYVASKYEGTWMWTGEAKVLQACRLAIIVTN